MLGQETKSELNTVSDSTISRVIGTVGHPNWVATWILISSPFAYLAPKFIRSNFIWYLSRIALLLGFITLIFTISRASIGLFLAFTSAVIFLNQIQNTKFTHLLEMRGFIFYSAIIGVCAFVIISNLDLIMLVLDVVEYRVSQASNSSDTGSGASLDYRVAMNIGALQGFMDNPLFGLGYTNMRHLWEEYGIYGIKDEMRPHNTYLSILVGGGMFCFVFFLYVVWYPLIAMLRSSKLIGINVAFVWGIITYLVLFIVYISPLGYQNLPFFFLLFGASMGYLDHRNK
ncbi:MAG: O-antigen ligase family protein [Reichenbachiella sp.]|uniref:O-antigen ligase family protein n=1 Tax=Reichenbachiella sp. TaxID=2184521 RepID=UPI00329A595A